MKALEKAPAERFLTAEEMYLALQQAVPEAFSTGIETQLREYLTTLLGDRATARREALRRAQVAADVRSGSGSHLAVNSSSSQSASSLQALSIDKPAAETGATPRLSSPPTLPAPAQKRSPRGFAITVALVAVLAIAAGVLHGQLSSGLRGNAAAPSAPLVELGSPSPAQAAHDQPSPPPSSAAEMTPSAVAPMRAASAGPATPASPTSSVSAARSPSTPAGKSRPRPRSRDLIAPDYAR